MTQLNPYLSFNGNCKEAITFYHQCIGGDLAIQTVAESPMADKLPPDMQSHVMHSSISKDGHFLIMASDMHRTKLLEGNTVHLCMNFSSEEEIRSAFTNLSEGGVILEGLAKMFWGGLFGALTDKYGKSWIFNYEEKAG